MIYETRLDLAHRETTAVLDFAPQLLTVINPTPYPVLVQKGVDVSGFGAYLVSAGTIMSVPAKTTEWGFRLLVSGVEPEEMSPVLIFFTQDEPAPTSTAIGVAAVTYRKTFAMVVPPEGGGSYNINSTTWLSLNDTIFDLELECPTGKALIGLNAFLERVDAISLWLGVADSLTGNVFRFTQLRQASVEGTFEGVIELGAAGLRHLYLRARLNAAATTGWNIRPAGYSATTRQYMFWGLGF